MMVRLRELILLGAAFCSACSCWAQQDSLYSEQDPPTRAARLSYSNGSVSMEPAGMDDWAPVEVNRPFTTGDYLYTDQKSVAELQLDSAVFRMGEVTSFGFLNLSDQIAQLKLTEGDLQFRVHDLAPSQVYEVDTPNAAITLLRDGVYRIHVDPDANTTYVTVREGQAEITGGGEAFTLNPGQSADLSGTSQLAYDIEQAPAPDVLDNWAVQRDRRESESVSARYVPRSMIGYEDLDRYGSWDQTDSYGAVWYPTQVPSGWAPYHSGHWVWIEPWGWTWVDAQPWGFAPCHYGRWVYWHDRWGWAPGPIGVDYGGFYRPVYAPAMVAWFGGAHWGVSVSFGSAPSYGWVPLGWGEIYTPSYYCGRNYFRNVNVYNTRVVNNVNITNVYNNVYVNKTVYHQTYVNAPRGAMVMPASALAAGHPVQQFARPLPPGEVERIQQARVITPGVVPQRTAVMPLLGRPAARPAAAVMARPVLARIAPPARVASFDQRQAFIEQHANQPMNYMAMHRQLAAEARPVAEARLVPQPARPAQVAVGQRVGNPPPSPMMRNQGASLPMTRNQSATEPSVRRPYAEGQRPVPEQARQAPPPPAAPVARGVPPNRQPMVSTPVAPPQPARANEQPRYGQEANRGYNQPQQPDRGTARNREYHGEARPQQQNEHGTPPNRGYAQQTRPEPQIQQQPQQPEPYRQPPPAEHGAPPNRVYGQQSRPEPQVQQQREPEPYRPPVQNERGMPPNRGGYQAPREQPQQQRYEAPRPAPQPRPMEQPRGGAPSQPHEPAPPRESRGGGERTQRR